MMVETMVATVQRFDGMSDVRCQVLCDGSGLERWRLMD